jgi:hypothetical protein
VNTEKLSLWHPYKVIIVCPVGFIDPPFKAQLFKTCKTLKVVVSTITKEFLIPLPLPNFPPYPIRVDSGLDSVILVVASTYFKLTQVPLQTIIIYRGNIGKAKIAHDCPTQGGRCHCHLHRLVKASHVHTPPSMQALWVFCHFCYNNQHKKKS